MASIVKDEAYFKRKEEFTEKLLAFHRIKGNPIRRFPLLGGRELDLYHLYIKVQQLGGSDIVTKERSWGEVARSFNLPNTVTSASYACRQNFLKFLQEYEQLEEQGTPFDPERFVPSTIPPPVRQPRVAPPSATPSPAPPRSSSRISQNPLIALSSHLPNLLALPGLQGLGNLLEQLSKSPEQLHVLSTMLNLPPNQVQLLELLMHQHQQHQQTRVLETARNDWLVRSLQSGFPNEVDFALNCLLVMSCDNKGILPLDRVPHLLDVLLAHVGVFSKDDPYLEVLYYEEWHDGDGQDYHLMWEETTPEHVYLTALEQPSLKSLSLFPSKSVASEDNVESTRTSQVAMVLRNLSFDEINAKFLASHDGVARFLLLGINSSLPTIKSLSLDTLTNLAPHLLVDSEEEEEEEMEEREEERDDGVSSLIVASLQQLVLSEDRFAVIRAIECLGLLAHSPLNAHSLFQIHPEVFLRMLHCLLLPDIQLITTCLDALYCLSFLGGRIGEMIIQSDHCVSILLNMLVFKCEGFQNVVEGLILIHPDNHQESVLVTPPEKKAKPNDSSDIKVTKSVSNASTQSSSPHLLKKDSSVTPSVTMTTHTPKQPNKVVKAPVKLTNQFSVPFIKVDESKSTFGKQWLQTHYESNPDEFISKREIYCKYLTSCAQLKIKTAATQPEFDQITKEAFPSVRFTNVKLSGQDIQLVGGIGKRPEIPVSVHSQHTSQAESVSMGSPSPTPSRSPSPSLLSPLQQLIQQTKTKSSIVSSSSIIKASPLLVSNRMMHSKLGTKTGHTGNNTSTTNLLLQNTDIQVDGNRSCDPSSDKSCDPPSMKSLMSGDLNKRSTSMPHDDYLIASSGSSNTLLNGNASSEEQLALLGNRKRSREEDDVEDNNISSKIARMECKETDDKRTECLLPKKQVSNSDRSDHTTPINHPPPPLSQKSNGTLSKETEDLRTVGLDPARSKEDRTKCGSSAAPLSQTRSHLEATPFRSSSLPPLIANQRHIPMKSFNPPSSSSNVQEKARSLTPPPSQVLPSTSDQLLDSIKLVKSVSATISTSLPGNHGISVSPAAAETSVICLWKNCLNIKSSKEDLFYHLVYDHLLSLPVKSKPVSSPCEWAGCQSKVKRMMPSLIRHVQTYHCSRGPRPVPPNVAQTLMKLRAVPSWENEEESSIMKSIRLTSALVLRNLLETVPEAKTCLLSHESTLTQVAFSTSEAGTVVARCLYLLSSTQSLLPRQQPPHTPESSPSSSTPVEVEQ